MYLAPMLKRPCRLFDRSHSYVTEADPDHLGANGIVAPGSLYSAPVGSTKSPPGMSSPKVVSAYIRPPCNISPRIVRGCHRISASRPCDVTFGIERTTKLVPRKLLSWKSSYCWWNSVALSSSDPSAQVVFAPSS